MTSKKIVTNNKTNILDAILTPQEYSQLKYKTPYILDFKKNNQEMLYIGVEHSRDYNAKQYLEIESLFEKFLKQYPSDTIIIAIENFIPPAQKSKNDSIVSYGESGLLLYLAKKYKLNYFCPEPTQDNIIQYILDKNLFKKEDIALWIFLNTLFNVLKKTPIIGEKELLFLDSIISSIVQRFESKKTDKYYWPLFIKRLREITGSDVLPNSANDLRFKQINIKLIEQLQNPFIKETILNDIGSMINYARDRFIADSIIKTIAHGKNIFAVFGVNHVVAQEPALRLIFSKKKSVLF